MSILYPELWEHCFTFLSAQDLLSLSLVNHCFNHHATLAFKKRLLSMSKDSGLVAAAGKPTDFDQPSSIRPCSLKFTSFEHRSRQPAAYTTSTNLQAEFEVKCSHKPSAVVGKTLHKCKMDGGAEHFTTFLVKISLRHNLPCRSLSAQVATRSFVDLHLMKSHVRVWTDLWQHHVPTYTEYNTAVTQHRFIPVDSSISGASIIVNPLTSPTHLDKTFSWHRLKLDVKKCVLQYEKALEGLQNQMK